MFVVIKVVDLHLSEECIHSGVILDVFININIRIVKLLFAEVKVLKFI